jgi:hypothetical protein
LKIIVIVGHKLATSSTVKTGQVKGFSCLLQHLQGYKPAKKGTRVSTMLEGEDGVSVVLFGG